VRPPSPFRVSISFFFPPPQFLKQAEGCALSCRNLFFFSFLQNPEKRGLRPFLSSLFLLDRAEHCVAEASYSCTLLPNLWKSFFVLEDERKRREPLLPSFLSPPFVARAEGRVTRFLVLLFFSFPLLNSNWSNARSFFPSTAEAAEEGIGPRFFFFLFPLPPSFSAEDNLMKVDPLFFSFFPFLTGS